MLNTVKKVSLAMTVNVTMFPTKLALTGSDFHVTMFPTNLALTGSDFHVALHVFQLGSSAILISTRWTTSHTLSTDSANTHCSTLSTQPSHCKAAQLACRM